MALPVLDGNQSATTLSSVVTGGEHIVAHSVVSLGANAISDITSAVSGSVVSISNFPATVTVGSLPNGVDFGQQIAEGYDNYGGAPIQIIQTSITIPISGTVTVGNSVTVAGTVTANPTGTQTIAGTVTANISSITSGAFGATIGGYDTVTNQQFLNCVPVKLFADGNGIIGKVSQSGSVTVGNSVTIGSLPAISGTVTIGNTVTVAGTVTANASNGTLTTRFGTPTTANTAFATSAVTNANRKYLLIQNVTTGSNVITVGIGFTPTTTQGIQLTAGAGITFESSYIPTGAVQILSSVTASNYTILEA